MRYLAVLIVFLCVNLTLNGQTIKFVDMKYQADVNVYFVKWKHQADAVVYQSPYRSYSKEDGVWWVNSGFGGVKVRVVKYKYQADVLIYVTDWRYQVKVGDKYKQFFK